MRGAPRWRDERGDLRRSGQSQEQGVLCDLRLQLDRDRLDGAIARCDDRDLDLHGLEDEEFLVFGHRVARGDEDLQHGADSGTLDLGGRAHEVYFADDRSTVTLRGPVGERVQYCGG